MTKRNAPVVITRKDKRLFKSAHLAALLLTGGMSAPISAAKAATNAGYNRRTRALMQRAEAEDYLAEVAPERFGEADREMLRDTDALIRELRGKS